MSFRTRGQENTITIRVEGKELVLQSEDFTITVNNEVMKTDFMGETASDLDYMHDGYDFSFSAHEADDSVLQFVAESDRRDGLGLAPQLCSVSVATLFRDGRRAVQVFPAAIMIVKDRSFGGRKEYTKYSFEGSAKQMAILTL